MSVASLFRRTEAGQVKLLELSKEVDTVEGQCFFNKKALDQLMAQLQAFCKDINESLRPTIEGLFSKVDSIDADTGAARYGPNTKTKITDMHLKIVEVCASFDILMAKYEVLIGEKRREYCDEEETVFEFSSSASQSTADSSWQAAEQKKAEEERKIKEANELAAKAGIIREQRHLQQTIEKENREAELQLIEREIQSTNNAYDCAIKEKETLMSILHAIRTATEMGNTLVNGGSSASTVLSRAAVQTNHQALTTLFKLLDNILRFPDDSKLRKINCTNTQIKEKLIRIPGGLEALLLIGFRITSAATEPTAGSSADIKLSHRYIIENKLWHLSLVEPNPETSTPIWIAWFDWLNSCRDVIEEFIKQHCNSR